MSKKNKKNKIAKQALKEASVRREEYLKKQKPPKELGGRKGLNPTRYGDWEKKGIVSDF